MPDLRTLRDAFAGRFEDWQIIAAGGEGHLYRVRDRWSGRIQALKIAAGSDGDGDSVSLAAEFDLLTRLRHPCLVESRDLVHHEGSQGHLLDYVPAMDPGTIHAAGGEEAILAAFVQSLRGLSYLHRHGWVHGDVAPGNILVWRDGEQWRARVADLGLVQREGGASTGTARGTLGYMAPEVARGDRGDARSDWFSLAATVVAWIDGAAPGDGLSPSDALKERAALTVPLRPRRQVTPRLEAWVRELSHPDPSRRQAPDWEELRNIEAAWGPPVLESGIHGLDEFVDEWSHWSTQLSLGRGGVIFLRGRIGSGRGTAAHALARRLVTRGWAQFSSEPLATVRDWIDGVERDPDPVRVARAVTERFASRNVVVVWPEALPESSQRLMQAFVAARDDDNDAGDTLVIRVANEGQEATADDWLRGTMTVAEVAWTGPGESGLREIAADLFPEEEGSLPHSHRERVEAGVTPLSLVLRKLAQVGGREGESVAEGMEEVRNEAAALFQRLSAPGRTGLALLAWSDRGWRDTSLGKVAAWGAASESTLKEIEGLAMVRGDFDGGVRRLRIPDWLSREAFRTISMTEEFREVAAAIGERLDSITEVHPGDLGLTTTLAEMGTVPSSYARGALKAGLAQGDYAGVLQFRRTLGSRVRIAATDRQAFGEMFLRATQRLGRFADEVEILRELLEANPEEGERIALKRNLASSLFAVGKWQEAVAECESIESDPEATEEDRIWALLGRAEAQWQARVFTEARDLFQLAEERLRPDMEQLWLKYAVGRARQAGQTGKMDEGRAWLEKARENAGDAACNDDPMYLNTLAGLLLTTESTRLAVEASRKASEVAERKGDWHTFIMANSRGSVIEMALGRMTVAAARSREAVATGLAFGSERMAALAGCYLGHALSENGLPEAAISRADWAYRQGEGGRDTPLIQNGLVLKAFTGAYYGLTEQFADAMAVLDQMERQQKRGQLAALRGLHHLVKLEYEQAQGEFNTTIEEYGRLSMVDSTLIYGVYLVEARLGLGRKLEAASAIASLHKSVVEYDLGQYLPICRILDALLNTPSLHGRIAIVESELSDLLANGSTKPVCFWSARILAELADADRTMLVGIHKRILGAIQKVSASCTDAQMRKAFLSAPRYRQVLVRLGT